MSELKSHIEAHLGQEFELLRAFSGDGKSQIFLAREKALRRLVAIKVLLPEAATNETTRERFGREGRSIASIRHRGVVDIYRVGELSDGLPYTVMEYIQGRSLADGLEARGTYPLERALEILSGIAAALAAAHGQGVIHRDLQPKNVIEERETGRIVLTDFSVAGVAPSREISEIRLTIDGKPIGNPRYSSPEQMLACEATEATDIYSLAVLGYELLAHRHPFEAETRGQMRVAKLREDAPDVREYCPEIAPVVAELLVRCLSKRAEQRPTAAEVGECLEAELRRLRSGIEPEAATEVDSSFAAFISEIRRRRVGQVAFAYVAATFVITQAAEQLLGPFPDLAWLHQLTVVVVLAGFAPSMMLAWIFDITARGIERTQARPELKNRSRTMLSLQVASLVVVTLLSVFLGWSILGRG